MFGYLSKPFREEDLLPAIADRPGALRASSPRCATRSRRCAEALAARKVIERAKGMLMAKHGLTEDAALGRLRKASQTSGRPLRVVAEAVVATMG